MRPRIFTIPQAATHMGVSQRTIRDWIARDWLTPLPGSLAHTGHYLFTEPALVEAEYRAKRGRVRRRRLTHPE
jgi:DNA-binding transcriptional MerR regulator